MIASVSPWRNLPGMALGLKQPILLGNLAVRLPADFCSAQLDNLFEDLTDGEFPAPQAISGSPQDLLGRMIHWSIMLQQYCNIPLSTNFHVGPGTSHTDGSVHFLVAVPYFAPRASVLALNWVANVFLKYAANNPAVISIAELDDEFANLRRSLQNFAAKGLNTFQFVQAAHRLDIPVRRVLSGVFCFGTGCYLRWLSSSATDRTTSMGVILARDKIATAQLLRQAGLPAPVHREVFNEEQALQAARRIGYPVVVKPVDQDQGRGVFAGLKSDTNLTAAVKGALQHSNRLLVEKHFSGNDYRLTVLQGEVIKIEQRIAGGVKGDGESSIAELVKAAQNSPHFRKIFRQTGKRRLSLDDEAMELLAENGFSPESVPDKGKFITLRRKNNISTGGTQILISPDTIHPDNLALAVRASEVLSLDFAGIDLLIPDIFVSWLDSGALICEVNAIPQIGIRTTPFIYEEILSTLLGCTSRIPVHLIVVSDRQYLANLELEQMMRKLSCNGLSSSDGVWVDGKRIPARPESGFQAAQILLAERSVNTALCILSSAEVSASGLPTDRLASAHFVGFNKKSQEDRKTIATLHLMIKPHLDIQTAERQRKLIPDSGKTANRT